MAGKSQYKYKPEFCSQIIEYGRQGLSKSAVASKFGVNRGTLYHWSNNPTDYPEFVSAWEQYETELNAYLDNTLRAVASGQLKLPQGGIAALIYMCRTCLGPKNPEYLIDLKREIKTEVVPPKEVVNEEIKRLLELARNDKRRSKSGESDSGTTSKAISIIEAARTADKAK